MARTLRIGGGAGFAGDRIGPAVDLVERGELDYGGGVRVHTEEVIGIVSTGIAREDVQPRVLHPQRSVSR
jgi:hypothetical protein